MSPISSKTTVAHCDLWPMSSKRTIAHNVFLKLYLPSKTTVAQCDLGHFRATGKFWTAFLTGFGFLRIRANLKQNDSSAECFDANFEQQDNCTRCFAQVLAF